MKTTAKAIPSVRVLLGCRDRQTIFEKAHSNLHSQTANIPSAGFIRKLQTMPSYVQYESGENSFRIGEITWQL